MIGLIIDGHDRAAYLDESGRAQTRFSGAASQRGSASVGLRVPAGDSYLPVVGNAISLYDQTGHRVFGGLITAITKTNEGNSEDALYACTCASFERFLDKHRISPCAFFNQTAGDIFMAVFQSLPGETITLGTVQAGPTIESKVYRRELIVDIFDDLAYIAGFVWGVDPDTEKLYFHAATATAAPFSLAGKDVLWNTIQWDTTQQDFRDRQFIAINMQAVSPDTDYCVGDGTKTSWPLRFPVDSITQVTALGGPATTVGTLAAEYTNLVADGGLVLGDWGKSATTYYFRTAFTGAPADTIEVLIGPDLSTTLNNLAEAINNGPNKGTDWQINGSAVSPHPNISAAPSGNDITLSARVTGSTGNTLFANPNWGFDCGLRFTGPPAGGPDEVYFQNGSDGPARASVQGAFSIKPISAVITIDQTTYTFVSALDYTIPNQVLIGTSADTAAINLAAAITGSPSNGAGTQFSLPTIPHPTVAGSY